MRQAVRLTNNGTAVRYSPSHLLASEGGERVPRASGEHALRAVQRRREVISQPVLLHLGVSAHNGSLPSFWSVVT